MGVVNALDNFCSQNPHFWGFYVWLLIGVKGQKGLLIGESDVIILYW